MSQAAALKSRFIPACSNIVGTSGIEMIEISAARHWDRDLFPRVPCGDRGRASGVINFFGHWLFWLNPILVNRVSTVVPYKTHLTSNNSYLSIQQYANLSQFIRIMYSYWSSSVLCILQPLHFLFTSSVQVSHNIVFFLCRSQWVCPTTQWSSLHWTLRARGSRWSSAA